MPLHSSRDGTPIVELDPIIEVTPFELFRRLRDSGAPPRLVDLRSSPRGWTLRGAISQTAETVTEDAEVDTVVFDQDGRTAPDVVRRLRRRGETRIWALFGGLELYRFCLDPKIVESDTFLEPLPED